MAAVIRMAAANCIESKGLRRPSFSVSLAADPVFVVLRAGAAAKVSAIVYSTLAVCSLYWLLFRYGVKHQLLWSAAC